MISPRFCLRCGGRLGATREEGRRRHRCRACGWIFYGNPVPAVAALVVQRGRILLVRRGRPPYAGLWDLPGGFLEAGETPGTGLRRELREELGMRVRTARLVALLTDRYGRGGFPILALVYRVSPVPGTLRPGDDVSGAQWFPRARLPLREVAFASNRRVLRAQAAPARLRGRRRRARAGSSRA